MNWNWIPILNMSCLPDWNHLPKHNKLCHGDYCPDNILVETDDTGKITAITAVDWVHATQGNASADVANTYLMLKLVDESFAEKYLVDFCKRPIPTAATSIHGFQS